MHHAQDNFHFGSIVLQEINSLGSLTVSDSNPTSVLSRGLIPQTTREFQRVLAQGKNRSRRQSGNRLRGPSAKRYATA